MRKQCFRKVFRQRLPKETGPSTSKTDKSNKKVKKKNDQRDSGGLKHCLWIRKKKFG